MIRFLRSLLRWLLSGVLVLLLAVAGINLWMIGSAEPIYSKVDEVPETDVALVLGASPFSLNGQPSQHFAGRMDAAAALHKAGRVKHLLLSGANPDARYNEPYRMQLALLERGVPVEAMSLDYAGRRTLDSVQRAGSIFGQQEVLIVSQRYHLYRALFLAESHGLQAAAFEAPGPYFSERWRTELREVLARVLALLDVYVLNTRPHFLGKTENIPLSDEPG